MPKPHVKKGLVSKFDRPQPLAGSKRKAAGAPAAAAQHTTRAKRPRPRNDAPATHGDAEGWRCHSVIDRQAAEAVARLLGAATSRRAGVTLKSLTLAPHVVHKKATHAVTCETLKYMPLLSSLLEVTRLREAHPQLTLPTALVLTFELLLGQGFKPAGPAERTVRAAEAELRAQLQRLMRDAGVKEPRQLLPKERTQAPGVAHPRTARVNTLRCSVATALARLRQPRNGGATAVVSEPRVDPLLPDVLVFEPGTDLHDHPLVQEGALVLQSKASCMPAHALAPEPGWCVVDCCAAPGNKTTHVAAMVGASGRVLAFDKDPIRLARLRENVERAGAGAIVEARRADFLALDTSAPEFAQVQGVILDPSCSGSGTVHSRMDHLLPRSSGAGEGATLAPDHAGSEESTRIERLAVFQEAALRHALTFPALQRLVYSTCSLHRRENEDVVAAVAEDAAKLGFTLSCALPAWPRRGLPGTAGCQALVRADPYEDGTDGFFVAVFERTSSGREGQQGKDGGSERGGVQGGWAAGKAGRHEKQAAGSDVTTGGGDAPRSSSSTHGKHHIRMRRAQKS